MLSFAWPWYAVLLPLPWLLGRLPRPASRHAALIVPDGMHLGGGSRENRSAGAATATRLAWVIWILLLVAACRPQLIGPPMGVPATSRDVVLAVDISASMGKRDFPMASGPIERVAAARQILRTLVDHRTEDRLSLILVADNAYVAAPLTFDHEAINQMIGEAVVGLAGRETALGDAIGLAVRRLAQDLHAQSRQRALVLLTDGMNNAGHLDPIDAAALAARQHLRIYPIGIGPEHPRVSSADSAPESAMELDESTLKRIAQITRGRYLRARDGTDLTLIYEEINRLEPVTADLEGLRSRIELFTWPLATAGLLTVAAYPGFRRWILRGRRLLRGRHAL
jgi:Ca-activated chloride channel family protein